ncbi:MAG: MerR family transcriptional regulator [Sedimentisphaerales bacterium]|nr:MerR family transcriptional regulator [Sedimentisphaerales bacterium]
MAQSQSGSEVLSIPAKLYRIGELVDYTPFSRQTIHNYTIMGLIREVEWTKGGHRLYDESVFQKLSRILQLKRTKSLAEIRRILSSEEAAGRLTPGRKNKDSAGNTRSIENN